MARVQVGVGSTVSIGEIEGATLVTEAEGISSNDNDTTIPTSAAVKDYADSVAGDMLAATYDPQAIGGDAFDTDNHTDGTTNKVFTATEKTKLAGIEAAADVTDATNVAMAGAFMKSTDDTDDISEGTTNKFATAAEKTKLGHITVTQAVDLDALETAVAALDQATILKGSWDASAGTFPGSGAAQAGWSYIVSVAGTVDGTAFAINDRIIAILDNASTSTFASNWFKADYTDQVLSVAGSTGAVTQDQITGLSSTGIVKRTAANTLGIATADTDYVTPTGTVTLTNKTLTKPVHNGTVQGINAASDGATITFDCAAANIHSVTLGGNRTLALSNTTAGQCLMLELKQDGTGSRTVTWFSGISWAGGSAPTLTTTAAKTDVIGIRVVTAGSAYIGYVIGQNI